MLAEGTTYVDFIRRELDREYARRESINSRAATAVTSATGLATLTLGAVGVVKSQGNALHGAGAGSTVVAVLLMLAAAIAALGSGHNPKHGVATADDLGKMLEDHWSDPDDVAVKATAHTDVRTTRSLRKGNNTKAQLLVVASGLQACAVLALLIATFLIV